MRFLLVLIILTFCVGCSTSTSMVSESDFFKETQTLQSTSKSNIEFAFISPDHDISSYQHVYIAPVIIKTKDRGQLNQIVKNQLSENYRLQLATIFKKAGLPVESHPTENSLEVHVAVTAISITKDIIELAKLLEIKEISEDTLQKKHIELRGELYLLDSKTDKTIAQFISIQKAQTDKFQSSSITYNELRPIAEENLTRTTFWVNQFLSPPQQVAIKE